jgi:hypothetical protein
VIGHLDLTAGPNMEAVEQNKPITWKVGRGGQTKGPDPTICSYEIAGIAT